MFRNKLFLLFGLLGFILYVESSCQNHLLSLSSNRRCENGRCYYSDVIHGKIDLVEFSQFCLTFDIEGDDSYKERMEITAKDIWVYYPLSECFLSDDPQYSFSAFCGCPGGSTANCNHCPIIGPNITKSICLDGFASSKGCLLSGSADYCSKVWTFGGGLIKVCSLGIPTVEVTLEILWKGETSVHQVTLSGNTYISGTNYNMTLFQPTFKEISEKYRIIFNGLEPEGFYFAKIGEVNTINTRDPSKLGWFRPDGEIPNVLRSYLNVYSENCQDNIFRLSSSARTFKQWFEINPQFSNSKLYPGSILIDPRSSMVQTRNVPQQDEIVNLKEGSYFMDISGDLFAVGILDTHQLPEAKSSIHTIDDFWSSCGPLINEPVACTPFRDTYWQYPYLYSMQTCNSLNNLGCWGVCNRYFNSSSGTFTKVCNSAGAAWATQYPSMEFTLWQFKGVPPEFYSIEDTNYQLQAASTAILLPPSNIQLDMILSLENIPVSFNTDDSVPIIDKISSDEDEIKVWAHVKGKDSTCLFISKDDIFVTTQAALDSESKKFDLRPQTKSFKGDTILILQCYKYQDQVKFKVEIENKNPDVETATISDSEVREASLHWSTWDYIVYGLKYPFVKIAGLTAIIKNYWWQTLLIYLGFLTLVGIIILVLVYIYFKLKLKFLGDTLPFVNPLKKFE